MLTGPPPACSPLLRRCGRQERLCLPGGQLSAKRERQRLIKRHRLSKGILNRVAQTAALVNVFWARGRAKRESLRIFSPWPGGGAPRPVCAKRSGRPRFCRGFPCARPAAVLLIVPFRMEIYTFCRKWANQPCAAPGICQPKWSVCSHSSAVSLPGSPRASR